MFEEMCSRLSRSFIKVMRSFYEKVELRTCNISLNQIYFNFILNIPYILNS